MLLHHNVINCIILPNNKQCHFITWVAGMNMSLICDFFKVSNITKQLRASFPDNKCVFQEFFDSLLQKNVPFLIPYLDPVQNYFTT